MRGSRIADAWSSLAARTVGRRDVPSAGRDRVGGRDPVGVACRRREANRDAVELPGCS